ncbi:hypothetical protein EII31_02700 [Leucobacter sp. OH2974_COT-288]|nr:hypothetical protein EII31_02700 [Leucobacter sp. OH2974_COT-288]
MVEWFTIAQMGAAALLLFACLGAAVLRRQPNDLTMGLTLLVTVGLLAQVVVALVAPAVGNPASGDLLEFWMYLLVAVALPIGAGVWALIDRSSWAHLILALVAFSLIVMEYRMMVIWGLW